MSSVWNYFDQLLCIPRPSGKEQKVNDWLITIAKTNNFKYNQDSAGNICLHIPSTPGYEKAETVILQAHSDMVTEKVAGSTFNFDTDPIKTIETDGWISAVDTTLGADNGIGLCMALAAATDPNYEHPALEILVTVEEETTFKGAINLDPVALNMKGTILLNLDNEEDGAIFVSSAGMIRMGATLDLIRHTEIDSSQSYLLISLENLPGGHSGAQIHEPVRENANLELLKFLSTFPNHLISIDGGDKDNAIPRNANAIVQVDPNLAFELTQNTMHTTHNHEFKVQVLTVEEVPFGPITQDIIPVLTAMQNGVISHHLEILDLVQTSSNLAYLKTSAQNLSLRISIRSCLNEDLFQIYNAQSALLQSIGFVCQKDRLTPGWNGNPNSDLVKLALESFTELTGLQGEIKAIHAGLEVGEISSKLEANSRKPIQSISFGPTILDAHSPSERVNIKSTDIAFAQLKLLLSKLAKK